MFEWKLKKSRVVFVLIMSILISCFIFIIYIPEITILTTSDTINRIESKDALEQFKDKWVQIECEYSYSAELYIGRLYGHKRDYGFCKVYGKDEYICCSSTDLIYNAMNDKNYIKNGHSNNTEWDGTFVVRGYVSKIPDMDYEMLISSINRVKPENNKSNTNLKYVIEMFDLDEEKEHFTKLSKLLGIMVLIFTITLFMLIKELKRYSEAKKEMLEKTSED
ncbi:MAG: hypothetical protein IJL20_04945 [Lachnospiraceae bacterium]|nr:hypothetical protein [Lachnospiraceae bacterium]